MFQSVKTWRNASLVIMVAMWMSLVLVADGDAAVTLDGFDIDEIADGFVDATGFSFLPDGRIIVIEQSGLAWLVDDGQVQSTPVVDLRAEVANGWDRGMLGIAVDPLFAETGTIALLYTVDPEFGDPNEPPQSDTFGRLTRYELIESDGDLVADLKSRHVLVGVNPDEGFPVCHSSHTIGTVKFALDGTLFAGAGDGAHFEFMDDGGADPGCFGGDLFDPSEDIGAFRSQYLGSLAGKIVRVDKETGLGLSDNPYWTGDGADAESKIWAYGLRNPYRFTVMPGSPSPGTLYIGDVGWGAWEEINVSHGGENFGWPCYAGFGLQTAYSSLGRPEHSDCDSIETPTNPGPLTEPLLTWHHSNPSISVPAGITGQAVAGGAFVTGDSYPAIYNGAFFFIEYWSSWMRILMPNSEGAELQVVEFGVDLSRPVAAEAHPLTGEIYFVSRQSGEVSRIFYDSADLTADGAVGPADLAIMLGNWGVCPTGTSCLADLNDDGTIGPADLALLLGSWGLLR